MLQRSICALLAWSCFMAASHSEDVAAIGEEDRFAVIDTPLPRDTEGHFDTEVSKISEWMSEIIELTTAKRYCYRVISEVSATYNVAKPEYAFQSRSLNFIRAEDPGKQIERTIVVSQSLTEDNAIRTKNGITLDQAVEFDLYRSPNEASMVRPVSPTGVIYGPIYPPDGDERFEVRLRHSKIFSPLLACFVPVSQTINGSGMSMRSHSLVPKAIKGSRTIGEYTHVMVVVGSTSMMITFKEERPVQLEHWSKVDEKSGEPVVSDRIGMRWAKCESGESVPVRIHGFRVARVFPGEFICKVDWKFGENVNKDYFDPASQGFIGFDELVDAK